jgi:nucleoside-diphosphate-sugar epimerase
MKVAIAGAGDLAHYMVEEFLAADHEVVVISRREKEWFMQQKVTFRVTDYSVASAAKAIEDCDALVSTILDYSLGSAGVHLALLEACKQSPKCKKYIPSEYGGNTDQYPDQPTFYYANHQPVREALRAQKDVMWTLFNLGWLVDYLIPAKSRYIKDIGYFHPVDLGEKTLKIPGTGNEPIAFTAARDCARAIAQLVTKDDWEETTYIAGETTTWNAINEKLAGRGLHLTTIYRPVAELERIVAAAESEDTVIAAQYDLWSTSGAGELPREKLLKQATKFFQGVKIRTVDEFLDEADSWVSGGLAV